MEQQPWWVYGLIAAGCAILYIVVKVMEGHVKDPFGLEIMGWIVGVIGVIMVLCAMNGLGIFT